LRDPLAAILPLLPRRFQLPIPLGLNLLLMPGKHVLWHVAMALFKRRLL
jgi:hypothetical protein